jgi:hypothetical protein
VDAKLRPDGEFTELLLSRRKCCNDTRIFIPAWWPVYTAIPFHVMLFHRYSGAELHAVVRQPDGTPNGGCGDPIRRLDSWQHWLRWREAWRSGTSDSTTARAQQNGLDIW